MLLSFGLIPQAFAPPDDPSCVEDGTYCDFTQAPFDAMIQPIALVFGVFTYPILYGIFLGIIWIRTRDPMTTGIIGLFMAGAGIGAGVLSDWNDQIIAMGALLFIIALGVVFYQLYIDKLARPT